MRQELKIEVLQDEVSGLIDALENPATVTKALLRAGDEGSQVILGKAQKERFRGKGPFPVRQRRLGVVTGRLRGSLFASKPRVKRDAVEFQVGSNVFYWQFHEYGSRRTPKRAPLAAAFEDHAEEDYQTAFNRALDRLLSQA